MPVSEKFHFCSRLQLPEASRGINGCVRLHQIPAIPESVSRSVPFDYIIPELEWPEFNSGDSGLEAEF